MLTRAATDLVWYGCVLSSHGESSAKYDLTEPIPLQVEHVAVEFVEHFRPSGPCFRTMKISAQRCRVGTCYFTHNWETRERRERLPSRKGPKDRPIALITCQACPAYLALVGFESDLPSSWTGFQPRLLNPVYLRMCGCPGAIFSFHRKFDLYVLFDVG